MGKARRFLGGLRREPGARPAVALAPLCGWIAAAVPRWERATVEPELLRARLADAYRDATLVPLHPLAFDAMAAGLDDQAWRRLALAVDALDFPEVRAALPTLLRSPADRQVREAFVEFARTTELLGLDLLRQSPLRVEEFTRGWLARLGAAIEDETEKESRQRLERLDYRRLLAETEKAREAAEARMEALRKIQEDRARKARRGKW